ncbi:MAG: PD40 domain-containing protein [Opitutales bacterium]|nr:PD40 domain-containing protein [Opitutales bacterium]
MNLPTATAGARRAFLRAMLPALATLSALAPHFARADDDTQRPPAGMLRYPAISADYITFGYATQLWIVPREGGLARPVASPAGSVLFPAFSPDGARIAFVANYDGQRDIHVIPVEGGIPRRITTHPGNKHIHGWTPDGEHIIYSTNFFSGNPRFEELYKVPRRGGTPEKLPVPYGVNATLSPDGKQMAYMLHSRDFRTWKRYAGGRASNIWIFDLEDHTSEKITDWEGTDTFPMWHGDAVYFLSDKREPWRFNLWRHDRATGAREQMTDFTHHDVRFPSLGPGPDGGGEIVFQLGQELHAIDLATREVRVVEVEIPGALPEIRPRAVDASKHIENRAISPKGARVLVEARGDIWSLPARRGSARNLTRTSGVAEREPAWSPDGKWILYSSDATGEYELYLMPADGSGEPRQLTEDNRRFYQDPRWAPDSKRFVVVDQTQRIWYGEVPEEGEDPVALREIGYNPAHRWIRLDWSPDSRWIVYSRTEDDGRFTLSTSALWAVEVETGEAHRLTRGMFSASNPAFDPKGEFLAFTAASEFSEPQYEDVGTTFVYHRTNRILLVPLRDDVASPLLPKSDEEDAGDEKDKDNGENGDDEEAEDGEDGEGKDGEEEEEKEEPMEFHWDGFEQRAILLPVDRGNFGALAFNDSRHLLYQRMTGNRRWDGESILHIFDPFKDDPEEETVLDNIRGFALSADRKKVLVRREGAAMAVIDAAPGQRWEHPVDTSAMRQRVVPREEWAQILRDAWRRHRDFFYVENPPRGRLGPSVGGLLRPSALPQQPRRPAVCHRRDDQ